jgi:hypothetical protein
MARLVLLIVSGKKPQRKGSSIASHCRVNRRHSSGAKGHGFRLPSSDQRVKGSVRLPHINAGHFRVPIPFPPIERRRLRTS